jgi:hypothetical protein
LQKKGRPTDEDRAAREEMTRAFPVTMRGSLVDVAAAMAIRPV